MRSLLYVSLMFCWFSFPLLSQAGIVPVREVQLKLFEKNLTGYRVSLPVPRLALQTAIRQYLAAYPVEPLVLEEGMIYENIDYPTITTARPITLYYLLQPVEEVFTELTVIGLYDYQHPITVHSQPDLALRMLLDLSEFVQGLTGNPVDFDALFARQSVTEITQRYESRKEQNYMDFFVEREGESIGSEGGTLLRENPFGENRPDNFGTDDQVVQAITERFSNYVAQNRSDSSPFLDDQGRGQILAYRDSLRQMQGQLAGLQTRIDTLLSRPLPVADTVLLEKIRLDSSRWVRQQENLTVLETQLATAEAQNQQLTFRWDSLNAVLSARRQPTEPELPITDQPDLAALSIRMKQLEQTNQRLQETVSRQERQENEYVRLQQTHQQLRDRFAFQTRIAEMNSFRADSLSVLTISLRQENDFLNESRDSLANELMVLNPNSEAARVRREVYRRQLAQLVESQQKQGNRELELTKREKQIDQRERYLAEFELTGESQALLSRIIQLENQLSILAKENKILKVKVGSEKNFQLSPYTLENPPNLQGYRFDPGVAPTFAREQILAWFQIRGMNPQQRKPLRFEQVLLPEISPQLLALSFYELESGRWLLSFTSEAGKPIQPQDVPVGELTQLLQEIFR